ncbi:Putative restriction endonuclease [Vibrio harveyi]|uniref:HNH endonuclease n=1 Tax=Vibrio harveyi TaxID=669 RepID=UPI002ADA592A|nr:HNH endonuclease [Vibrio harveyi]CAK6715043.1 Putative restriction endonuclease [Vibrio harveyi]
MSFKRNIESDIAITNSILGLIEKGIEQEIAVNNLNTQGANWLGHKLGAATHLLDLALLRGATMTELDDIRGGAITHIEHLKSEHGITVEFNGSKYKIVKKIELINPIISSDYIELNKLADELDLQNATPKGQLRPKKVTLTTTGYERDAAVVAAALKEADGKCELCGSRSFPTLTRSAFLEVHHLKYLSESGSDQLSNVVAVCPTCHKELHFGIRAEELKTKLYDMIPRLVRE